MSVLDALVQALAEGRLEVVDLSAPLSPETPILTLPPEFGQTATFELEEIGRRHALSTAPTSSSAGGAP
jgi:kynurenine formamidase